MLALGLLEDDNLLRAALQDSLGAKGFRIAVSSSNVADFISSTSRSHIDCAILDVHLGGGATGIDVARKLAATYPKLGLVFLTSFDDPRLIGVSPGELPEGSVYLPKQVVKETEVLVQAIEQSIAKAPNQRAAVGGVLSLLTDSQIQVLALVAAGLSNSEIARIRHSSEKSVESTLTRISKTLGLKSDPGVNHRVHMARVYFRARGVPIESD